MMNLKIFNYYCLDSNYGGVIFPCEYIDPLSSPSVLALQREDIINQNN